MCDHICLKLDIFLLLWRQKMTFCCFVVLVAQRELAKKKVTYFRFVALIGAWFLVPELTGILRICGG